MHEAWRVAKDGPAPAADASGLGHPDLAVYDTARHLFVATGLRPEPAAYEVFWLHLTGADPALSRAIGQAMADGGLRFERLLELRRTHLGDITASELLSIMTSARTASGRLADSVDVARAEIEAHDRLLMEEDRRLGSAALSAAAVAATIDRLRRANARMLAANRRLEADIARVRLETATLLERLESAERAARTDPLTGLLNRRGLLDSLRQAIDDARRTAGPLSVALVDLDRFRTFNERWGHDIGDEVLRYVGGFFTQCLKSRPGARAGRVGGEEFVLVLPGLSVSAATAGVEAIRAALARQVVRRATDGERLGRIAFSAGVAGLRDGDDEDRLLDRAEAALDSAKRGGRDRVVPERPAGSLAA
ncbi:MAG: GGDEF domain-containing protein [Sphingomonadaceae bacterium]|uniref:GGDEF domain-containing protein n=1 Tax=Thermaurantiacus sp. TaxID=2820283 RepID=UPI00298EE94A|nr:GGDEF domain-containing protein [Thermaurantiacus sp.]MCS6987433.1 GGDEF domain-containing protein [Sphingomonadaceae bacterium]MDW8415353.1 GGDEF domain-containing protein [Thermaurantiacus sp.]